MSLSEMLNVVRPSGLLSPDDLLDAIQTRSESRDMDLNYRGMLSKCRTMQTDELDTLAESQCSHLYPKPLNSQRLNRHEAANQVNSCQLSL